MNCVATNETVFKKFETKIQQITPHFIKTKSSVRGKVLPPLTQPIYSSHDGGSGF